MQAETKPKQPLPSRTKEAGDAGRRTERGGGPQPLRPGAPNGWRRGRVLRTLWPAAPGTQRWLKRHGTALVCVRHREDPVGLRRVVTVELLVGEVRSRQRARRLNPQAMYPLRVPPGMRGLRPLLQSQGARPDVQQGLWFARGHVIEALGLIDWIVLPSLQRL
jgi:hypothetical protein